MVNGITGRELRSQPAARRCCRLSDFRPPQLSNLPPPLTTSTRGEESKRTRDFFSWSLNLLSVRSSVWRGYELQCRRVHRPSIRRHQEAEKILREEDISSGLLISCCLLSSGSRAAEQRSRRLPLPSIRGHQQEAKRV